MAASQRVTGNKEKCFNRGFMIFIQAKGKYQNRFRQIASGILVAAALTACESMSEIGDDFAEMSRGLVQYE
ncbi:MAG: hypothetical protein HOE26_02220, partial [Rhodospirillaceae bacterium]|nr:hypothetical protein [Rhodospirillaceae bacterium]